ncbi:TRM11 family SAM-dependent methyltransferase [Flexivirga sp.]|uniref:TRM11 family SAM-dependent methyltransferase n=1 Tax=Flexivirga sp. TaxID=1962927 RepID=UPI003F80B221
MTTPLLLTCPVGLEDLVRGDLRDREDVRSELLAPGLIRCVEALTPDKLPAMVDRVSLPLSDDNSVIAAAELVGVPTPSFRVHAKDPGARSEWITRIEALGWRNDPSDWVLNVDVGGGRIDLGSWHWSRRIGQLQRLPATTPGPVAAGLLRLAKLSTGDVLLDPCAGVGTVPIVDALLRGGPAYSIDRDPEATRLAHENAANLSVGQAVSVLKADATDLPLDDGSIDRVVSDLPFGKRIGSNELNKSLYPAILREIERVLTADGRAVLLSDDKRVFAESVAHARGLKISGERVIRYNGVTPTAYIVRRSRRPKRGRA